MRGRTVFMDALAAHGVTHIFGNPGTTENPILDSLLDYPQFDIHVDRAKAALYGVSQEMVARHVVTNDCRTQWKTNRSGRKISGN